MRADSVAHNDRRPVGAGRQEEDKIVPTIDLHDTAYEGRTSGQPWSGPLPALECTRCGSSLTRRRIGVKRQTTRGIHEVVETFKCGCGRRRHVRREAHVIRGELTPRE